MFHFNDDQISTILNTSTENDFSYFTRIASRFRQEYKPLFFTPYRSINEFGLELIAPVHHPLQLGGMSATSFMFAFLAAIVGIVSLLVSAIAGLFLHTKMQNNAYDCASNALILLGSSIITGVTCCLLAFASIPYTICSLVSRSIASLLSIEPQEEERFEINNNQLL